jgi:hypothetical protein
VGDENRSDASPATGGVLWRDRAVCPPEEHVMGKWSVVLAVCVAAVLMTASVAGAAQRVVLAEMFGGTW